MTSCIDSCAHATKHESELSRIMHQMSLCINSCTHASIFKSMHPCTHAPMHPCMQEYLRHVLLGAQGPAGQPHQQSHSLAGAFSSSPPSVTLSQQPPRRRTSSAVHLDALTLDGLSQQADEQSHSRSSQGGLRTAKSAGLPLQSRLSALSRLRSISIAGSRSMWGAVRSARSLQSIKPTHELSVWRSFKLMWNGVFSGRPSLAPAAAATAPGAISNPLSTTASRSASRSGAAAEDAQDVCDPSSSPLVTQLRGLRVSMGIAIGQFIALFELF